MSNITNYLNKVKTAIYGKEVRGAIHDAIKQVYDDASVEHDNANMEVKLARGTHNTLNDRLDNVDEIQAQTNAQLSQVNVELFNKTTQIVNSKEESGALYKKRVVLHLPLIFKDYDSLVKQVNANYLYPQGITHDDKTGEFFIVYGPEGATDTTRWIVVYDEFGNYKGVFGAGNAGGEGAVIKYEGDKRFIYLQSKASYLGKYDITNPSNKEVLTPIDEYDVNLFFNFSHRKGVWLVEQRGPSLGTNNRRNVISFFDDSFKKKGDTRIGLGDGGFWVGDYTDYIPKRQGFALGDSCIYQSTGGWYGGTSETPYMYAGVKVLNMDGSLRDEALVYPSMMMDILTKHGYEATKIEYEGCCYTEDNKLYSLCVTRGRQETNANQGGLIIFEEIAKEGYIDFTNASASYARFNHLELANGIFPRKNDGIYDPLKGTKFNNLKEIIGFMRGTDLMRFAFYSSAVTILDLNNEEIPSGCYVEIKNANHNTFFMTWTGDEFKSKTFVIYDNTENITVQKIIDGFDEVELVLENGITNFWNGYSAKVKKDSSNIVTMTGLVNNIPSTRPITITKLPSEFTPKIANLSFTVALSASTHGGYGVITVMNNGNVDLVYTSSDVNYCSLNGINFVL